MVRSNFAIRWLAIGMLALLTGCGGSNSPSSTSTTPTPPPETPADKMVELNVGAGPVQRPVELSRGSQQTVEWKNNDDRGHTLRFNRWPFVEPWQDIYVDANGKSKKFHVYKSASESGSIDHTYGVFPPIPGDPGHDPAASATGPPDPPAVVVND